MTALVAPTIAAEKGGGTTKYVNTAGDAMEGDLDMQGHSMVLAGTPLQGATDGELLYGGLRVCLDGGPACQGPQGPEGPMGPPGPQGPPGPGLEDGSVMGNHVAAGQIDQHHLAFDPATQAELNANQADSDSKIAAIETVLWVLDDGLGALALDLATDDGSPPNGGRNLVHWNNLYGVPGDFADGNDAVDGGTATDLDCTGCITSDDIGANAVGADELAADAVDTGSIQDMAVTSSKIDPFFIGELMSANAASSASPTTVFVEPFTPTTIASATLAVSGSTHVVLLTGQFQAQLVSSMDPSERVLFEWRLFNDGVEVSPPYYASVQETGANSAFGSVSVIDQASPGTSTYSLVVEVHTADSWVTFSSAVLNAVDLGTT